MKADLGILLLLVGFTLAYLVLAGKIPSALSVVSSSSTPTKAPTGTPPPPGGGSVSVGTTNVAKGIGSGPGGTSPMGLPTMGYFHDLVASQGGMQ